MKHITLKVGGLGLLAAGAWHFGGMISAHTITLFMGFLLGAFVGIPAMLLMAQNAQRKRVDVYHHSAPQTQQQPLQLSVKPARYIVVGEQPTLSQQPQRQIEVS